MASTIRGSDNFDSAPVVVKGGKSANQTLSASVWTKVAFDTSSIAVNGSWNTSSYRFTPSIAGYYQVNTSICELPNNAQPLLLSIYKNGANYSYTGQTNGYGACLGDVVYMNGSTDYIEIYAVSFATGNTIYGGGALGQFVSVIKVS